MRARLWGMTLSAVVACQTGHQPGPRPESVTPSLVVAGAPVLLTIHGRFAPPVRADFARHEVVMPTDFEVRVGWLDLGLAEFVDKQTLRVLLPADVPLGVHDLTVRDRRGRGHTLTAAFTVVVAAVDAVVVEDAPGGAGQELDEVTLTPGMTLGLFAVGRAAGAFVADVAVGWQVEGAIGSLASVHGTSTVFTAGEPGSGWVVGDLDGALTDSTGVITVRRCAADGECDNGDLCDGLERCLGGACVGGSRLDCADTDPCTAEYCEPLLGCQYPPAAPVDLDGDGYALGCGGEDCDDTPAPEGCGAACHPGISADTNCDGYDNDCNGAADDGYQIIESCGVGWCAMQATPSSCRDGVEESCLPGPPAAESIVAGTCGDGIDNDCDGETDTEDYACGVNTPPLAALSVTPAAGESSATFVADATASTDREDPPASLSFAWDFEHSGTFVAGAATAAPVFPDLGVHRISVRVTDSGGLSAYASFDVLVVDAAALGEVTAGDDVTDGTCDASHCSLREALAWARETPGIQTIVVPPGTTVALSSGLQITSDAVGVDLIGDGAVLDGAGISANSACLAVSGGSANVRIFGLEITNCPSYAINLADGTNVTVARCFIHHNGNSVSYNVAGNTFGPGNVVVEHLAAGTHGIQMNEPGLITGNLFRDNTGWGIYLNHRRTAPSDLFGNQVVGNASGGIFLTLQCDANRLWHNTIHGNGSDGIRFGNDVDNEVINNSISANAGWGISGDDLNLAALHHNAFFANASGMCSGGAACTLGPGTVTDDPLYVDPAAGDFRPRPASPLVNAGVELGADVNGPAPGVFNGAAPDLGAHESP